MSVQFDARRYLETAIVPALVILAGCLLLSYLAVDVYGGEMPRGWDLVLLVTTTALYVLAIQACIVAFCAACGLAVQLQRYLWLDHRTLAPPRPAWRLSPRSPPPMSALTSRSRSESLGSR